MGYTTALALEEELSLEAGLAYHLQGNHYPPVPVSMVQPCIDAIDAFYDEEYSRCLLYTSPSPRDRQKSRMPSSA